MVDPCVNRFFFQTPKMSCYLYENHRGSPTLTMLNVLGVLGVLNVLHVLHVLHGRIVGLLGLVPILTMPFSFPLIFSFSSSLFSPLIFSRTWFWSDVIWLNAGVRTCVRLRVCACILVCPFACVRLYSCACVCAVRAFDRLRARTCVRIMPTRVCVCP